MKHFLVFAALVAVVYCCGVGFLRVAAKMGWHEEGQAERYDFHKEGK